MKNFYLRHVALVLVLAPIGTAWAQKKVRAPSVACAFDVKKMTVVSDAPVDAYDNKQSPIEVYPELSSLDDFIPPTVTVKVQYEVQNCQEPLQAELSLFGLIGTTRINFENRDTVDTQIASARTNSKWSEKPWVKASSNLTKLKNAGEIVFKKVPVLKFYEKLQAGQHAWSVRFEFKIFEKEREVAHKELTLENDLEI